MAGADPSQRFTAAIGHRYDFLNLINGKVQPEGIEVEYPPVVEGAPAPIFSRLAREHPWDIGEQGFSTYLMCFDLGKPQIALPVFPSRFFPHTGVSVTEHSGIKEPRDLEGKRVSCTSWGTNYSVWWRGALSHQYDVAVEKITWVESVEEHLTEYRPPSRFQIEKAEANAATLLAEGKVDAATQAGGGQQRGASPNVHPLFADPYPQLRDYVKANGFFPINTVITVARSAVERNPEMPRLMLDTFIRAKKLYDDEIAAAGTDEHMGLSLRKLREDVGLVLPEYGFEANRRAIQTMIAYCYEQGIIRKLVSPEHLFLVTDS